jgi:hypothetical protein
MGCMQIFHILSYPPGKDIQEQSFLLLEDRERPLCSGVPRAIKDLQINPHKNNQK